MTPEELALIKRIGDSVLEVKKDHLELQKDFLILEKAILIIQITLIEIQERNSHA